MRHTPCALPASPAAARVQHSILTQIASHAEQRIAMRRARVTEKKKEESTRTGIGSANAKRLSLNNSLTRRVGRQRGRRNSRGLG